MAKLGVQLDLKRCPHCNVDVPRMDMRCEVQTNTYANDRLRWWRVYCCARCGGLVTAAAADRENPVTEIYPPVSGVEEAIPERARAYLKQALNSLSSPAGAVMLAASSVDAMLKARGLREGSLYSRIDKAAEEHLITREMAKWAHEVRLDANDQRHADEGAPLPTTADAQRAVDFTTALGQFMFVLPARVQRGIAEAKE